MKIIKTGETYKVYGEGLIVLDNLPAQVYKIGFAQFSGFFLEKQPDLEVKEDKIYGVHEKKADKVLNRFQIVNKNLGVILSGDKGIGKSLFARILSQKAINNGIPVILVDQYIPGIGDFINEIRNEVLVLFDEFDKTFKSKEEDPQSQMLSLFDGTSSGKKLFVITCNKYNDLNEYLLNRPGRFHFHLRFDYPTAEEIENYLKDKLNPTFYSEIEKVTSFSRKVKLNYDCLSAIAIELNEGETFADAIRDLNIMNDLRSSSRSYNICLFTEEGELFQANNIYIDLFDKNKIVSLWLEDSYGNDDIEIKLNVKDMHYDKVKGCFVINQKDFKIDFDNHDYNKNLVNQYKALHYTHAEITLNYGNDYHFNIAY